jgi:transposase
MPEKPTIVEFDMDKLQEALRRAEEALSAEDSKMLRTLADAYAYLTELVGNKDTTIHRLRQMLFGAKTEKTSAVVGSAPSAGTPPPAGEGPGVSPSAPQDAAACAAAAGADAPAEAGEATEAQKGPAARRKGHGRNGAAAYTGAEKIKVPHQSLKPGDPCPTCGDGTVYETGRPGVLVRLVGQAPVGAEVYYLQKLRCGLCGTLFTAQPPEGVGGEEGQKYDATVGSMIALMKYGQGMPFNRMENLQEGLGIPLPASTQWDIVADRAERAEPMFDEVVRQAAQGDVMYNDDTTVKILEVMRDRARQAALDEAAAADVADDAEEDVASSVKDVEADRTGMFTTGIVSTREGRKIALFFSGRQHAGENLEDVLRKRAAGRPPPIQMCDPLSRNLPKELATIVANCLAHGRRQFVDVAASFPEPCRRVLEDLAVVYKNDKLARQGKLSPEERLRFHQVESGPTMENLHAWLGEQINDHLVEPNSGLGKAIRYLLRHWKELTLFLRVPGAPLDNNTCERALKKAILHRKNALFYKTRRGAHVGDVFMSLIYTCALNGANPFDYLTELERHAGEASANPSSWMPWNYRESLAGTRHAQASSEEGRQEERHGVTAAQGAGEA